MLITIDIPEALAALVRKGTESLSCTVVKALALEGIRTGRLTVAQARRLLGIESRYEMDGFLKAHGVFLDATVEDVERDAGTALAFRQ